jgi:hypothetical protein
VRRDENKVTEKLSRLQSLLSYADNQQKEISNEYSQYLDGNIPATLQIKIKNYFENLRSLLDYIASDICADVLRLRERHKCYFPIYCDSQNDFVRFCGINFPGLETTDPRIYATLANIQPFNTDEFSSLKLLSVYTNQNKHRDLSPQRANEETRAASRFKVIRFSDIGANGLAQDNCDGYLIADETREDPFLSSDYILENIGKVVELNPAFLRYKSFQFTDSGHDVIATLINLHRAVSSVLARFMEPLYNRDMPN